METHASKFRTFETFITIRRDFSVSSKIVEGGTFVENIRYLCNFDNH